jgi:serine/threonine protein kinase
MAPELNMTLRQFPQPGYGVETDVWSFGVVCFLLHYEEPPFDKDDHGYPEMSSLWSPTNVTSFAPIHPSATMTLAGMLQPEPAKRNSLSTILAQSWLGC